MILKRGNRIKASHPNEGILSSATPPVGLVTISRTSTTLPLFLNGESDSLPFLKYLPQCKKRLFAVLISKSTRTEPGASGLQTLASDEGKQERESF
jgi:hypothetical protein